MKEESFKSVQSLTLENSFGTLREENNITLTFNVGYRQEEDNSYYGWFEFYDDETGGEDWYAEGGLWFDQEKELVSYDGVFSLAQPIIDKIREWGFTYDD